MPLPGVLLDGDVDGGGIAGCGVGLNVGGNARERGGGEGDGAVKDGGGSGGPGGEEIEGWSDGVDQAGRGCGGELMEGYPSKGQDRETRGASLRFQGRSQRRRRGCA